LGDPGTTYWKALWDDKGMYVIVVVNDNVWSPYTGLVANSNDYNYDKIEMYFDTNYILEDGLGGQTGTTGNRQIAPNPTLDKLDGEKLSTVVQGGTVNYAFKVENPTWNFEIFVPWESIPDGQGVLFDKTAPMGFDVQVTDNDDGLNARNRVYWSNAGLKDECWNNMDDAGHITLDGVGDAVDISSITISGDQTITTDNGTVQLSSVVLPADATQGFRWKITDGAANATINKDGIVTAIRDGVVKVKATSNDEFVSSNELTINISGQKTTLNEVSFIKDGDFTMGTATTQSLFWHGGGAAPIENGVYTIVNPTLSTDPWGYTVGQTINIPQDMKDLAYVLQFKAWADEPRIFDVDIEHGATSYLRFGDTPDANADAGHSQWTYNLTTEPTVYTQTITNFSRMEPLPQIQNFNLFAGRGTAKVYVDDIVLVTKADFDQFAVTSAKNIAQSINKVYRQDNSLFVELAKTNVKVAIYNALGQKMMEKVSTGNVAKFNVGNLNKGMYIVKLSDGTSQKFIK
jgi:hypothetical protein